MTAPTAAPELKRVMPVGIPSPASISDPATRLFAEAVIANMQVWAGLSGNRDDWMVNRKDMVGASVVGHDKLGRLVPVVKNSVAGGTSHQGSPVDAILSGLRVGVVSIASGVQTVTVTGLALLSVPTKIYVDVISPNSTAPGWLRITAHVRYDTVTVDGFTVSLSGVTDTTGYSLAYITVD